MVWNIKVPPPSREGLEPPPRKCKRSDSVDSDCSDDFTFPAIDTGTPTHPENNILVYSWVIKDFFQSLAIAEENRVYRPSDHRDDVSLGSFTLPGQVLPGVAFQFSLTAANEPDRSSLMSTLNHVAKFTDAESRIQRCWTNVTAELLSAATTVNILCENVTVDDQSQQEDFKVIATIKLGPNALVNHMYRGHNVSSLAWPLDFLRAAASSDGSLRIRISLQLYDVGRSIRSRDTICGLRGNGISTSDFVIKVGNEQFAVHKCILAAASCDFRSICSDEGVGGVLDLTHVATAEAVKAFVALLYFDAYDWVALEGVVLKDALMLASCFKTEHVKEQLNTVIAKIVNLENVLNILTTAIESGASKAREICIAFLMRNHDAVRMSGCLDSLLESSPDKQKIRAEFVRALFNRQFCNGGRPETAGANSDSPFPHHEVTISETWFLSNLSAALSKATFANLQRTSRSCQYGFESSKRRAQTMEWQFMLHTRGHTTALQRQDGASFTLDLCSPDGKYQVCWAYVDISIVNPNDDSCRPVVQDQLVEFSSYKGLVVDRGWTVGSLLQLSSNNSLLVNLDLRLVNVNEILGFSEKSTSPSANEADEIIDFVDEEVVETWYIDGAKRWLAGGQTLKYEFKFQHQKHRGASWHVSLWPNRLVTNVNTRSSFTHFAKFGSDEDDVGHCWTHLTAELVIPPNKIGRMEAFDNVVFGPNELTGYAYSSHVTSSAWSQSVLQAAVHDDDTLRIRLSLKIFDVAEAIKSRDALRDLRRLNVAGDFSLKLASAVFPVHKSILMAASGEFLAKFGGSNVSECDLTSLSVSASAVKAFLALGYRDAYAWKSDKDVVSTIVGVLKLANEFKTERVKDLMAAVVPKFLSSENVLHILNATIACDAARARSACCVFLLTQNRSAVENSCWLRDVLEQSEEGDLVRRAFVLTFFETSAENCYCKKMGCPDQRMLQIEKPCGLIQQIINVAWRIQNADVKMQKAKVDYEFMLVDEEGISEYNDERRSAKQFTLHLYPSGRSRKVEFERFSSFSILPDSRKTHSQESLVAYVSVSLEKDGVSTFATDADGQSRMLVEFTKSRGLLIDKAWPAAALRNAILDDNTICVKIELQIVNVRESLVCHEMMRAIYEQRAFSDFSLVCEGESIVVHKCVLAQRSQIFAAMLSNEMRESTQSCLDLTSVTTVEGLRAFVSAIYCVDSKDTTNGELTFEVLKLAHQYGLQDVKREYDRKLADHIDMENILDVLTAAKLYGLAYALAACMRYLRTNSIEFLRSQAWKDLTTDESRSELRDAVTVDLILSEVSVKQKA